MVSEPDESKNSRGNANSFCDYVLSWRKIYFLWNLVLGESARPSLASSLPFHVLKSILYAYWPREGFHAEGGLGGGGREGTLHVWWGVCEGEGGITVLDMGWGLEKMKISGCALFVGVGVERCVTRGNFFFLSRAPLLFRKCVGEQGLCCVV